MLLTNAVVAASTLAVIVSAAPAPLDRAQPQRLHLKRDGLKRRSENLAEFALKQKAGLLNRYGSTTESSKRKRATSVATLSDYGLDSSYYATISVGSPSQSFYVIVDVRSLGSRSR